MAIDLARLIDEVLRMAKARQSQIAFGESADRSARSDEAYNKRWHEKEMAGRGHGYAMEKQKLVGSQEAGIWDRRIAGEQSLQEGKTAGELAKERIAGEFKMQGIGKEAEYRTRIGEMTSGAARMASENRLAGDRERAQAERDKATIGATTREDPRKEILKSWMGSMNPTMESLDLGIAGYEKLFPKPPEPELVNVDRRAGRSFEERAAPYLNAPVRPSAATFMREGAPAIAPPPTVAPAPSLTPEEQYAKTYESTKSAMGTSILRSPENIKKSKEYWANENARMAKEQEERKKKRPWASF